MPIPDDAFFADWEAALPEEQRARFCRDGVIDEEAWAAAPVKLLFVAGDPTGSAVPADARDARAFFADKAGSGSFGTPLARWAAMIVGGLSAEEAQALKKKDLAGYAKGSAVIHLKKTAGESSASDAEVTEWAMADGNDERLLDQIDKIDPRVIVVCGTQACAAWPVLLTEDPAAQPVLQSQEFGWDGRSVLATLSPSAPGTKTDDKDADAARFAASPEVAALRG